MSRQDKASAQQQKRRTQVNDDWIDRALRELGDHLLDREVPERLSRVLRRKPDTENKSEESER